MTPKVRYSRFLLLLLALLMSLLFSCGGGGGGSTTTGNVGNESTTVPPPPPIPPVLPTPDTFSMTIAVPFSGGGGAISGALAAKVVLPEGVKLVENGSLPNGYLIKIIGSQSPASSYTIVSYDPPTLIAPGQIKLQVYEPAGFSPSETVSVQLNFSTVNIPAVTDFKVIDILVSDLNGQVSSVPNAAYTVSVGKRFAKTAPMLQPAQPDGVIDPANSTGTPTLSDFIITAQIAMGVLTPTPLQLQHADVAPLINGLPAPDGIMNIGDALLILRRVSGMISW